MTMLTALGAWPIASEAEQSKFPVDEETLTRALKTDCAHIKREIASGDRTLSKGFDYAKDLAKHEPWAKHPFLARIGIADAAACIKLMILQGEAVSHLEREMGIVRTRNMPKPGSLHHRVALISGSTWPALAVIEMIGLSQDWQAMAQSAKRSLSRGVAKLIRRGVTIKCIRKFSQDLTHGLAALDLAGNAERKKQALTDLARSGDGGIGVMMEQWLSGVPEPCRPACGPRRSN